MKYQSYTITTTTECADIVSMILMEEGAEGAMILDKNDLRDALDNSYWDYVDPSLLAKDERVFVSAILPLGYDKSLLLQRLSELKKISEFDTGSLECQSSIVDSLDYENEWKKYYEPFLIGAIRVIPSWLKEQTSTNFGEIPLYLNPGKAFGTGSHQTTSICIELMQGLDFKQKFVIDLGSGSGILGIAAKKLGADKLVMIDIDPCAIEASAENAQLNNINDCEIRDGGINDGEVADIILANLTTPILKALSNSIKKGFKEYLIISGIIEGSQDDALKAFEEFEVVEQRKSGDWYAFVLRKQGRE